MAKSTYNQGIIGENINKVPPNDIFVIYPLYIVTSHLLSLQQLTVGWFCYQLQSYSKEHCVAKYNTVQYSEVQCITVQYSKV